MSSKNVTKKAAKKNPSEVETLRSMVRILKKDLKSLVVATAPVDGSVCICASCHLAKKLANKYDIDIM